MFLFWFKSYILRLTRSISGQRLIDRTDIRVRRQSSVCPFVIQVQPENWLDIICVPIVLTYDLCNVDNVRNIAETKPPQVVSNENRKLVFIFYTNKQNPNNKTLILTFYSLSYRQSLGARKLKLYRQLRFMM